MRLCAILVIVRYGKGSIKVVIIRAENILCMGAYAWFTKRTDVADTTVTDVGQFLFKRLLQALVYKILQLWKLFQCEQSATRSCISHL